MMKKNRVRMKTNVRVTKVKAQGDRDVIINLTTHIKDEHKE